MNQIRWQKIESLFNSAVVLPREDQSRFIIDSSGSDQELRDEVLEMLEQLNANADFLEEPIIAKGFNLLGSSTKSDELYEGQKLGSYKILCRLATGGMGEVYLAEDERLSRKVALKVLSAVRGGVESQKESSLRFRQEALAASKVIHPNVAHIYEFVCIEEKKEDESGNEGDEGGTTASGKYIITMEYVEGRTLREILKNEELSLREILEISIQIANALAAAHQVGVIHRDIKPENIMLRPDYHVKVLDFGLAKALPTVPVAGVTGEVEGCGDGSPSPPENLNKLAAANTGALKTSGEESIKDSAFLTTPGILLGTPSYMSPEQVRGEIVDHRTDIWSFGVVLYEMLTGKTPFQGRSPADTISSILTEKLDFPESLKEPRQREFVRIINRCLNKDPEMRFQSARDLAFAIETFSKTTFSGRFYSLSERATASAVQVWSGKGWRAFFILIGFVLLAVIGILSYQSVSKENGVFGFGENHAAVGDKPLPEYRQLTFQRGTVWSARFVPGDQLIFYSSTWNGDSLNVFFTKPSINAGSKSLNLPETNLLSISSKGELAVLRTQKHIYQFINQGILQRMPLGGNSPRDVAQDVQEADWAPDGENLVIVRNITQGNRIEYPINNVLWETRGYVSSPRFSPDGQEIAFLEHPKQGDNRGYVSIIDKNGRRRVLTDEWSGVEGLAWNSLSGEIWFTATKAGENYALYAVTPGGSVRRVLTAPVHLLLFDISKSGEVLFSRAHQFTSIYKVSENESGEKNLTWQYAVAIGDFANDGNSYVFTHFGEGSGTNYQVYFRNIREIDPILLGNGRALAISPDKNFVLAKLNQPEQLTILPVKAGEKQILPQGEIEQYDRGSWFPNGREILITGRRKGESLNRCFLQNLTNGEIKPLTPEGVSGFKISPDGKKILVRGPNGEWLFFTIEGSPSMTPVPNLSSMEEPIGWAADSQSIFISRKGAAEPARDTASPSAPALSTSSNGELTGEGASVTAATPIEIYQLNLVSGEKRHLKTINPQDKAGIFGAPYVFVTPDGKNFLYGFRRYMFDLQMVNNLQ